MTVTARFKLNAIVDQGGDHVTASFGAHVGKGSEDFAKYTPWGELKMGITKGANALKMLEVGKVYDLAFNEADLTENNAAVKVSE